MIRPVDVRCLYDLLDMARTDDKTVPQSQHWERRDFSKTDRYGADHGQQRQYTARFRVSHTRDL